ncbi:MAG: hypothetical protein KDA81_15335 [Planctomycetaceae bacterium]|nr:hypothetical protein [Planctomycetaceae bacterium]
MNETTTSLLTLFAVIGGGLALGKVSFRGLSLGTSGVIFAGIVAGQFHFEVPRQLGSAGIVLFVYCLGTGAGPTFLQVVRHHGKVLCALALLMLVSALAAACGTAWLMHLDVDLTAGLFAGSLTSTPALAAAMERLPADSKVAVGYGVAYPFGVLGVILFAELAPRILSASSAASSHSNEPVEVRIERRLVRVENPGILNKRIRDISSIRNSNCQVPRIMSEGKLIPVPSNYQLQLRDELLVVGDRNGLAEVIDVLGEEISNPGYTFDVERHRRRVIVTSREITGKSLADLHLLSRFGITISRIQRHDIEFVPRATDRIQPGDALTAVGEESGLEKFILFAGHRERMFDETDLISLSVGLVLGILVGSIDFRLGDNSIALGLAGGPLLVGLLFGHLGNFGFIVGHMPRAARLILSEIGLSLFLVQAGAQAGQSFFRTITENGLMLCVGASAIVVVPIVVGMFAGRYLFRMSTLELCGAICGAMTSTPGLGAITAKVDSGVPTASYSAVYPFALIMVTILMPLLLHFV